MVYFLTFLPDDYNGEPEAAIMSPPDDFPETPTKEEVFDRWTEAGYSSYYWRGEDEFTSQYTPEQCFEEFQNYPLYYAIYMIITKGQELTLEMFNQNFQNEFTADYPLSVNSPEYVMKFLIEQMGDVISDVIIL